ncbi:hypothetical protein J3D55_002562 [Chryseobacterium ginsenosidimutans]|uniref:hypothetical protein n=1 Tax=Chryseobacterium ginsenosidimutans TaxID=687846 RepID=UPI002168E219|nr:hypothetical protein [Chryseobacterium ginsenosidimutans]MCS3869646.1 hypothetical protein [Chryseobacterium ginsenosidimutans]
MTTIEYYKEAGSTVTNILHESLSNTDLELFNSNHSFLADFESWLEILKDRPEISIFKNAIKEYQISQLSCSLGLYQQAFMGLRFFLERTLVAIMFSAKEIELNLWKIGERDTYWSELMDDEKGVFSKKFCRAFFSELDSEISHFKAITKKVYRECSEYVHGNLSVIDKIPEGLEYSEELFIEWNTLANIIKRIVLFSICLRYLKFLKTEDYKEIEASISEEFTSISVIMQYINQ